VSEIIFRDPLHLTEDLRILRDQLHRFVDNEVVPVGDAWEEQGYVPRPVLRQMGDLGFLGLRHPVDYGGGDLDALATVVLGEEMGRSSYGGFAACVTVHTDMASPHLVRYGTKAQKDKYLPAVIAGEKITAVGVTEPGAGSDVANMRTRAVRDGDHYVLNGAKMYITNGVYGDLFFIAARTDAEVKPSRGISMFIVEKGTPGFSVGRELKKHGWLSSDTAELVFEDCRVPAENLLGEENRGFYSIMGNFQTERLSLAGQALGASMRAIEITLDWLKARKAFGGALWDNPAIRQRMAMAAAKVEAARQMTYHAAWLDANGEDAVREISMVKAYSAETCSQVMYDCLQFHGGMGIMRECAIERMTRDSRVNPIGGGATEVMLEEVAKRL